MAFKIVWTINAQKDRLAILQYWIERNKSTIFAIKLNEVFNERVALLAQYPNLGKKTDMRQIKAHVVKDYIIFYKIIEKAIVIVSIFDARQNPRKLKKVGR